MLTKYGYGDLAYLVATNPTAPGWGQWFLQCGATTMWESWEDSSCDTARSHDHAFMGTVDDWMFADVAGIQSTSPGFRKVDIAPSAVDELTSASGEEATPLGPVSSSWTRQRQPLRPDRPRSSGLHRDRLRPGSRCGLGDRGRSPGGPRGRSDRHRHAGLVPAAQGRLGQLPLRLAAVLENGRRAHPRVFA